MVWEQEPIVKCFHSFFKFSQTFMSVSTETEHALNIYLSISVLLKR